MSDHREDHADRHLNGGPDELAGLLNAVARVGVRKNSTGSVFERRRLNFIEGTNVTLTVADDSANEEVDITIASTGGGGTSDHGLLTGLGDDDHTQYALLLGRAGGQTLIGGTASGDDLILKSTSHATLGHIGLNDEELANVGKLRVGSGPNASTTEIMAGSAATVSDGTSKTVASFGGNRTFDTTNGGSYTLLNSAVSVVATANMTNLIGLNFSPTKAGTGTLTTLIGCKVAPVAGTGATTTATAGQFTLTSQIGTTTTAIGLDVNIDATLGGTNTTAIGLRIGASTFVGTTKWGIQVVPDIPSYHVGKFSFGGSTSPTYGIHMLATGGDAGSIHLNEVTTTPTNPASSAGVVVYQKADKLVFAFNNAGTMRYFTLDLTQTGATATWAQSTTAP